MKKFTKMLALGLAAAMMFGMTVNAEESPRTKDFEEIVDTFQKEGVNKGATITKITDEQLEKEFGGKTYEEVVADASNEKKNPAYAAGMADIVGYEIAAADTVVVELTGKTPLKFRLGPAVKGTGYIVQHWNGKTWDDVQVCFDGEGAYVVFDSLSPVAITTLTLTGDGPQPLYDNGGDSAATPAAPSTTPVSPKTGETLPVAGMMAVLFLAGAVICVKKARCNG